MERIPFQFTLVSSEWTTLRRQLIASVGFSGMEAEARDFSWAHEYVWRWFIS